MHCLQTYGSSCGLWLETVASYRLMTQIDCAMCVATAFKRMVLIEIMI